MVDKKDVAVGVAAGAAIGALAGILFAPKSGKQTRDDISKFADETKQKIAKKVHELTHLTKEQYNRIVDIAVDEGGETWKVATADLVQLKTDLKARYDAVRTRLQTSSSK